jgi:dTDP-4-dehydrorhamnose reductase
MEGAAMKVLFTGGSGLLGREVQKLRPEWEYPSHFDFDVCSRRFPAGPFDVVVHAAAITSPPIADKDPMAAMAANIEGTSNVTLWCNWMQARLIYISTDYVFRGLVGKYMPENAVAPVNKYAWSKLGGECAVRMYDKGLIVRGSFGAVPFPYDKAFVDQYTTRVPVTEFSRRLVEIVERDPPVYGVVHIAGKRQTVLEYARSVSPEKEIGPLRRDEVSFVVPYDTSLVEGVEA